MKFDYLDEQPEASHRYDLLEGKECIFERFLGKTPFYGPPFIPFQRGLYGLCAPFRRIFHGL